MVWFEDPSRGKGRCSLRDLVLGDMTTADMAVIAAASKLDQKNGVLPTAAQIGEELKSTHPPKRSQLYATIRKLSDLGFLSASFLGTPRTYRVDKGTIITGSKEWLRRQRESLRSIHENLVHTIDVLEENEVKDIASIMESEIITE